MEEDLKAAVKSCILWVPRGRAAEEPRLVDVVVADGETEIASDVVESETERAKAAVDRLVGNKHMVDEGDELLKELDMDNYDKDTAMDSMIGAPLFGLRQKEVELGLKGDPMLKKEEDIPESDDEDDLRISDKEFVLVSCSVEKIDQCGFETYIYDHDEATTYLHHDTILSAFPLTAELLPRWGSNVGGQMIAVSGFEPVIEIWDNDVIGSFECLAELGGAKSSSKERHMDAVNALHANALTGNQLASASADSTLRFWDLTEMRHAQVLQVHTNKIASVQWHPVEATVVASGGEDKVLAVCDIRDASQSAKYTGESEWESVCWNRHDPFILMGTTTSGRFIGVDVRNMMSGKSVWDIAVTQAPLLSVCDSLIAGLVVTCGEEEIASVWDIRKAQPIEVDKKNLQAGCLYCCKASPDAQVPTLIAFGGSEICVWDLASSEAVVKHFS